MAIFKSIKDWHSRQAERLAGVSVKTGGGVVGTVRAEEGISCSNDVQWRIRTIDDFGSPFVADSNYMTLFHTVPEVFFPIDFIARRIAGAHFEIRSYKDDSIVYCTGRTSKANKMNAILQAPNSIQRWREFVYMHFAQLLVTGNAFVRAAMPDAFGDLPKWEYCKRFWPVPSKWVSVQPASDSIPLFGIADLDDIVGGYKIQPNASSTIQVPANQIWHARDGMAQFLNTTGSNFLKSNSRLDSVHKAISNLVAVYEARNVIYVKRGALGYIVARKDGGELGPQAMKPSEKKQLVDDLNGDWGLTDGKNPISITDVPIDFVKINTSIQELQPFEETLLDAITIAGAYGIPDVLVPRKDHSTFSNQAVAEKSAYCGTIIPMAKQFCEELTLFLGLDMSGYYVDVNFNDVDCLQIGLKEAEEVKKLVNERCRQQFNDGLISINDWRAQIHESAMEGDVFGKTKLEMSPEELERIERIIKPNTNQQSSTGEDNGRNIETDSVSDQDR